jgi:hypothetical protein
MIKILKYNEIDFNRYSQCLANSCQNADYADQNFLDIVSKKQWFLLVSGDYEAIMPVSYIRKFGFIIILMPKICQQLGVFSAKDDTKTNKLFYDFLEKNFLVSNYAFNGDNSFDDDLKRKTSYLLIANDYSTIKKNYSSHRRRNVRIIGDLVGNMTTRNVLQKSDQEFFLKNVKGASNDKDAAIYFDLLKELLEKNIGHLRIIEFKNKIQSLVYLYEGQNNRYLSLFINESPSVNPNFPSIMIDYSLQEFIGDKNFDFMGSEVQNVAQFNERFGADSYQYSVIANSKITLLKNIAKRFRNMTNFAP